MTTVIWGFLNREVDIELLGERVGYTWTCGDNSHEHRIECLWVWHLCTMELDPARAERARRSDESIRWGPTGVGAHDLINVRPLHLEASVYWPACCGLHGWIREGRWIDVNDIQ